jgi:hypothetical protein
MAVQGNVVGSAVEKVQVNVGVNRLKDQLCFKVVDIYDLSAASG